MRITPKCIVVSIVASIATSCGAFAEDSSPYPRVTWDAFKSRLPFFDYDTSVPLEGRVVREWKRDGTLKQKFVFRGAQGFFVPGYLEIPDNAKKPCPLVLLLHGWSGNKEGWYEDENIISGGIMRKALLGAGYGILALDAATHGERSNEIGYQHVNPFEDPNAPPQKNFFTYAEISVQTVKDYRRALDYVATRTEIDSGRVGIVGYSMGGMDSFYLLSVEPRIKMAVACVPPLQSDGYGPTSPIDYTWGIGRKPFLMLMGNQDDMYEKPRVDASYKLYIENPNSKIIWYDQPHKLSPVYVPDALEWVKTHL
jgi:dienelactone hydrolase